MTVNRPFFLNLSIFLQRVDAAESSKTSEQTKSSMFNPPAYDSVAQEKFPKIVIKDKEGNAHGPVDEYFLAASRYVRK